MVDNNYKWQRAIAYFFSWIGGLIIYFIIDTDKETKFHAMQSIVLGGIIGIVCFTLRLVPFIGFVTGIVISILMTVRLVLSIIGIILSVQDKKFEIPVISDIARGFMD